MVRTLMPKTPPPRKAKRPDPGARRPRAETFDVFALLAEDVEPHAPEGWFKLPWRDGRQAIDLITHLLRGTYGCQMTSDEAEQVSDVATLDVTDPDLYWRCEALREDVVRINTPSSTAELMLMRLRMLQLYTSNSHGGGHGYNAVFLRGWHKLDARAVAPAERLVEHYRMFDALGVEGSLANVSPRRQQAFAAAWRAGMFRAAYALARGEP